jgi:hypothetical protein
MSLATQTTTDTRDAELRAQVASLEHKLERLQKREAELENIIRAVPERIVHFFWIRRQGFRSYLSGRKGMGPHLLAHVHGRITLMP